MAGLLSSVRQSVYLKIMLVAYAITLCALAHRLLKGTALDSTALPLNRTSGLSTYRHQGPRTNTGTNPLLKTKGYPVSDTIRRLGEGVITSKCTNTVFPGKYFRPETWWKVGPKNSTVVFSAYHDELHKGWIKVVGICVRRHEQQHCQLWYAGDGSDTGEMKTVKAGVTMLHNSPTRYTSCFIKCPLPDSRMPVAVSVVSTDGCAAADNVLLVRNIPRQDYTRNFTVCLSPLNFRYGRAYELVEWIELNRILGADRFVIYNHSSAVNVASVLDYYTTLGVVEVVQWPLPIGVDRWPHTKDPVEVHYFAQMASLNDCLLRTKAESEFLVNLDIDEFIIPHANTLFNWNDVIGRLPHHSGAYLFRNSFFRKEWTTKNLDFSEKRLAEKYDLVTLLKAERETKIHPGRLRSKYIARTSAVEVIVTHDVTSFSNGRRSHVVNPDVALLHHYRNWLQYNGSEPRTTDMTVIDKYSKVLTDRVASVWDRLADVKMDIPI